MLKLNLSGVVARPERSIMEALKAEPINAEIDEATGKIRTLLVKFPGHSAYGLTADEAIQIADRLDTPTPKGETPAAVFNRTFSEKGDGSFSAFFSDGERSRVLEVGASERAELAEYFRSLAAGWDGWQETANAIRASEAEKAAKNPAPNTPPADGTVKRGPGRPRKNA